MVRSRVLHLRAWLDQRGREVIEYAVSLTPGAVPLHGALAQLANPRKDGDEAFARSLSVLPLDPAHFLALFGVACVQTALRRDDATVSTLDELLRRFPGHPLVRIDHAARPRSARERPAVDEIRNFCMTGRPMSPNGGVQRVGPYSHSRPFVGPTPLELVFGAFSRIRAPRHSFVHMTRAVRGEGAPSV